MHNTLAEDIYDKKRDTLKIQMLSEFTYRGMDRGNCLDREMNEALIGKAGELLKEDYPQITLSDYRRFSVDGNREYFEDKYFKRRRMLTTLILAEYVEDRGRFVDRILDGMYLIMEETSWCLPAHNTYIRDELQLKIPHKSRPIIDLFAAETGLSRCATGRHGLLKTYFQNGNILLLCCIACSGRCGMEYAVYPG
ncbi:MAG: hypothetical protein K6E98_02100 [Lachnospiraceae bacterium]|nr:hypothetical protein [Lachnospiraceae bacterium]